MKRALCLAITLIMLLSVGIISTPKVYADETPSILFLGTLCNARGLSAGETDEETGKISADSVRAILNNLAGKGNVTYYLFSGDQDDTGAQIAGNLEKGSEISENFEYKKDCHRALQAYLNVINDELVTQANAYDFIVLLFDSARLAVGYDSENEYLEKVVAAAMNTYYEDGKVIWLVDEKNLFEPEYDYANYSVNNYYDQGSTENGYLQKSAYKALSALLSPFDYYNWKEEFPQYYNNTRYELIGVDEDAKTSYSGDWEAFLDKRLETESEVLKETAQTYLTEKESQIEITEETQVPTLTEVTEAEDTYPETQTLEETEPDLEPEIVEEYVPLAPEEPAEETEPAVEETVQETIDTSPDTGDSNHILLYVLLCAFAMLLICLNTSVLLFKKN